MLSNSMFGFGPISKRLVAAYIFDWIMIVVIAAISLAFSKQSPHYRAFSLIDLSISFPYTDELITFWYLVLATVIGPALIIFGVCILFVPGPAALKRLPWRTILVRKVWEWNAGWMGLALSLATEVLVVQGTKNAFGKPRPDLLSRCNPDVNNIQNYIVGTPYGQDVSPHWVLVSNDICQNTDKAVLDDGFRSFPSGHAGTAFAGLLYLTLWLCAKFSIVFPYLPTHSLKRKPIQGPLTNGLGNNRATTRSEDAADRPMLQDTLRKKDNDDFTEYRDEAAAPPTWLLLVAYVPIGVAIFIAASRFFDYRHHGFDILFGSAIGIVTAWFSFRWYHLPVTRGAGWSWGPRSPGRAFAIGVGTQGYVSFNERLPTARRRDLEMGSLQQQQAQERNIGSDEPDSSSANGRRRADNTRFDTASSSTSA